MASCGHRKIAVSPQRALLVEATYEQAEQERGVLEDKKSLEYTSRIQ